VRSIGAACVGRYGMYSVMNKKWVSIYLIAICQIMTRFYPATVLNAAHGIAKAFLSV